MKMIHWNKTETDCGVVAAFNASAWCNIKTTYKKVEKVARSCGYSEKGIYFFQFDYLVKKLNIPAKKVALKGVKDLEKRLYRGKFFIFLYTPTEVKGSGHAITAFVDHTGNIRIVNPEPGGKRFTWRRFVTDLNENGVKNFAAWEVPQRSLR